MLDEIYCYSAVKEDIWKLIGKISPKVKTDLEVRFKKLNGIMNKEETTNEKMELVKL